MWNRRIVCTADRVRGAIFGAMIGEALENEYLALKKQNLHELPQNALWELGAVGEETWIMTELFKQIQRNPENLERVLKAYAKQKQNNVQDFSPAYPESPNKPHFQDPTTETLSYTTLIPRQISWCIRGLSETLEDMLQSIRLDYSLHQDTNVSLTECELYAITLRALMAGKKRPTLWQTLLDVKIPPVKQQELLDTYFYFPVRLRNHPDVQPTLERTVLHNTLYHLWRTESFAGGLRRSIISNPSQAKQGMATGAILGAYWGVTGIPETWLLKLLNNPKNTTEPLDIRQFVVFVEETLIAHRQRRRQRCYRALI